MGIARYWEGCLGHGLSLATHRADPFQQRGSGSSLNGEQDVLAKGSEPDLAESWWGPNGRKHPWPSPDTSCGFNRRRYRKWVSHWELRNCWPRLGPASVAYKSWEPLRHGTPEDMELSRVAGPLRPAGRLLLLLCIKTLATQAADTCPGEADLKLVTRSR